MMSNIYKGRACLVLLFAMSLSLYYAPAIGQDAFFSDLFKVYTPRALCMSFEPAVIGVHLVSDTLIALAYFSIPIGLIYFVRWRRDLMFNAAFLSFAVFILACGLTHLMNIVALWHPLYRLDGMIKLATAAASVTTAIMLWPWIPRALAIPSAGTLQRLNQQLSDEIAEKRAVEQQLKQANDDLERRVENRTAQLREAHQRVTSILESITDCFCAVDRSWRYTYINAKAQAYFGLSKEAMLGKSVWELFPHAVGTLTYERYQSAMASGQAEHFEILSPVSHRWLAVHIYSSDDGLAFFWEDIHERRQTEEALAQARERFAAFFENSPAPGWIKDEHGVYAFINQAAEQALGAAPGTGKGASDAELVGPAIAAQLQRNDREVLTSGSPVQTVEVINGRHMLVAKFPLRGRDNQPLVGGTAIDITDRIARETAEREANQRKDTFLAILSHELRNPLHAIRAPLAVLRHVSPGSPEAVRAREIMERQAAHLTRLLDDLLDASRITQGRLQLRKQELTLSQVIEQCIEMSRALIEAKGMLLTIRLPAEPLHLYADPVRLCQVFSNLLNNSVKYSPPGNPIVVEANREGDSVTVSVIDSGIGMDMHQLSQIFQLFVSVHKGDAKLQDGLGVGLAISRTLVEMHGGAIEASSPGPGKGARFSVRLPLRTDSSAPPAQPKPAGDECTELAGRKILVVDDNRDSADSVSLFLEMQGVQVRTVYTGQSAVRAAQDFRPEAILLDIGLPDLDGHQVAREIRRLARDHTPILLATTGWGHEADKQATRDAGFAHHLVKPIDFQQLPALLAKLLATSSSSD